MSYIRKTCEPGASRAWPMVPQALWRRCWLGQACCWRQPDRVGGQSLEGASPFECDFAVAFIWAGMRFAKTVSFMTRPVDLIAEGSQGWNGVLPQPSAPITWYVTYARDIPAICLVSNTFYLACTLIFVIFLVYIWTILMMKRKFQLHSIHQQYICMEHI